VVHATDRTETAKGWYNPETYPVLSAFYRASPEVRNKVIEMDRTRGRDAAVSFLKLLAGGFSAS
jgi:hypothetical protein